jgi:hypothetical protein
VRIKQSGDSIIQKRILGTILLMAATTLFAATLCMKNVYKSCGSRTCYTSCGLTGCGLPLSCVAPSPGSFRDVDLADSEGRDDLFHIGTYTCNWTCCAICDAHAEPWNWPASSTLVKDEWRITGNLCTNRSGS